MTSLRQPPLPPIGEQMQGNETEEEITAKCCHHTGFYMVETQDQPGTTSHENKGKIDRFMIIPYDQGMGTYFNQNKETILFVVHCSPNNQHNPFQSKEVYMGKMMPDGDNGNSSCRDEVYCSCCTEKMMPNGDNGNSSGKEVHCICYTEQLVTDKEIKKLSSEIEVDIQNTNVYRMNKTKRISSVARRINSQVEDEESSFLYMISKDLVAYGQREFLSKSLRSNQSLAYQMAEMNQSDPRRKEILTRIKRSRGNPLNMMMGDVDLFSIICFFTTSILVAAVVLINWRQIKDYKKSCDVDEALQLLKLSSTVTCKYEDIKTKLEKISILGLASLIIAVIWFLVGWIFKLISPLRVLPKTFGFTLFLIFISGLAFGIVFLTIGTEVVDSKTEQTEINYTKIETYMKESLKKEYTSDMISNSDTMSDRWNRFFIKYDCCAVSQVNGTTNDFDTTPWCTTSGSCQQTNSQIPKTCCKAVTEKDYVYASKDCHETVSVGTYKDGCFAMLMKLGDKTLTESDVNDLYKILLIMGTLQIVFAANILLICICGCIRKN